MSDKPRFKITDMERKVVKDEMRALMIETAQARATVTYSDLSFQLETVPLHYHSFVFADLLREIGGEEEAAGRPLLPAVVVRKSSGIPGGGFFRLTPVEGAPDSTLEDYWRDEVEQVYAYWSQQQPPESE